MAAEVFETLPRSGDKPAPVDHTVIDLARKAANRAYGKKEESESTDNPTETQTETETES